MAGFYIVLLSSLLTVCGIFVIAAYVLLVVAQWRIFTKAGESGWKSLIPVYNMYTQYKVTWNTSAFWFALFFSLVSAFAAQYEGGVWTFVCDICALGSFVIYVAGSYKLAKAFGHGIGFTILLMFCPNIGTLILGFGGSEYYGPQ